MRGINGQALSWHAVFCVVLAVLQFGLIISVGFVLSVVGVFLRDFVIVLPNILMIILFSTPILYPLRMTPEFIQKISSVNPFYIISEGYRQVLLYHHVPDIFGILYLGAVSLVLALAGLKLFRRYKGYFEARL